MTELASKTNSDNTPVHTYSSCSPRPTDQTWTAPSSPGQLPANLQILQQRTTIIKCLQAPTQFDCRHSMPYKRCITIIISKQIKIIIARSHLRWISVSVTIAHNLTKWPWTLQNWLCSWPVILTCELIWDFLSIYVTKSRNQTSAIV